MECDEEQNSINEDDQDWYEQPAFQDVSVIAEEVGDYESDNEHNDNESFIDKFRQWALNSNLAQTKQDELLKMLKKQFLPQLPTCSKTFLKTASAEYIIENCPGKTTDGEIV
ncbi:hypothetical protein HCN44_007829 [Aphidius gifuensis]|uniref:Uncharacterized protein n=1 Tax=Aphidius gifuensis TaxID=684658 RepID=A0A834XLS8_APHGI|nr:hypothetical protein HCN44_007829 [Aphidius gifuensis]